MSYTVGQIIYLLSRKDVKVFPARVIEEIKRKTIDEEMISYIIRLPDKEKTEVLLEEISADVFTSIENVEKKMIENAHSQIKIFLQGARRMESLFEPSKIVKEGIPDDKVEIDLGDGVKGKIDLNQIPTGG
jgi:hypothetical protein